MKKITISDFFFYISYILFIISLFLSDINYPEVDDLVKIIKILVVFTMFISICYRKFYQYEIRRIIFAILIGSVILVASHDFFWITVLIMGVITRDMDTNNLFKWTAMTCSIMMLSTILLSILGVLPDVINYRSDIYDIDTRARHSYGFVHSSVIPLIIFYLSTYYVYSKQQKIKPFMLIMLGVLSLVAYLACESRNAFFSTMLLLISTIIFRMNSPSVLGEKILNRIMPFFILIACVAFSIMPGILRYYDVFTPFWYIYDAIFTNRSITLASAIESYGIHLINFMSYEEYKMVDVNIESWTFTGMVLDSAYAYFLVRYGVFILLMVVYLFYVLLKRVQNKPLERNVLLIIMMANCIDNDIMSYGFLPYIIIASREIYLTKFVKRDGFERQDKRYS